VSVFQFFVVLLVQALVGAVRRSPAPSVPIG
jgi:hypothetical protein